MKFLLSVLLGFTLFTFKTDAQDTVFMRSGRRLQCRITEVGTTYIKYQNWNEIMDPNYVIQRSDIAWIKFESGNVEIYAKSMYDKYVKAREKRAKANQIKTTPVQDNTPTVTTPPKKIDTVPPRKPQQIDTTLRFDLGLVFPALAPGNIGLGFGLSLALKLMVAPNIYVGIRQEFISFSGGGDSVYSNIGYLSNTSIQLEYYFKDWKKLRPYAGIGLNFCETGLLKSPHNQDSTMISLHTTEANPQSYSSLGLSPTVGFDINRFNFSMTYTILGRRTITFTEYGNSPAGYRYSQGSRIATTYGFYGTSFIELRAAIMFGGKCKPRT